MQFSINALVQVLLIQARTQGFEKGGYIVKRFPLNFWHFNVGARINNFVENMKPIIMKQYLSVTCSVYIHKINYSKSRLAASILQGCFCKNCLQSVSTSMPA